tara:strand:- start:23 stop:685 length:663 start_codon:yes stop_codon:yes gene_type:complete
MKIACVGYRDWALKIYHFLEKYTDHDFLIISSKAAYDKQKIIDFNPELVLFYGWSWKIEEDIYANYMSVMLHPSDLPKFRGGSPIQNQIINGVLDSKVTLFVINEGYDAGQILAKGDLSLRGHIQDIFDRLTFVGTNLTMRLIDSPHAPFATPYEQDHDAATYYKRRTPKESEITVEEILNKSAEFLYNKIRMLEDPYPNAYIRTSDGKKLLIKMAEIEE